MTRKRSFRIPPDPKLPYYEDVHGVEKKTARKRQIRSPQAQGSIAPERVRAAVSQVTAARKALDYCVAVATATARIKAIGREIEGCGCEPPYHHTDKPRAPHFNAYIEAFDGSYGPTTAENYYEESSEETLAKRDEVWRQLQDCLQCWRLYELVQERKRLRQERGRARRALALIGRAELKRRVAT